MNDEVSVCVSMASSQVTKFSDLDEEKLIFGAAGAGNDDDLFSRIMNAILGTMMQVITTYPGGNDIVLAMERGEVMGRCGWSWSSIKASQPDWIVQNKINVLVQLGLSKHSDLPNVPLIMDLAKNEEERQSLKLVFAWQTPGRPFLGPPGIASDRSVLLRSVFRKTVSDPELRAEADREKIEIEPLTGENLENVIHQVFSDTSPQLARKISGYINLN
jgi:tripartite-type tricarboxylate transporter receptor subunit TctC